MKEVRPLVFDVNNCQGAYYDVNGAHVSNASGARTFALQQSQHCGIPYKKAELSQR